MIGMTQRMDPNELIAKNDSRVEKWLETLKSGDYSQPYPYPKSLSSYLNDWDYNTWCDTHEVNHGPCPISPDPVAE